VGGGERGSFDLAFFVLCALPSPLARLWRGEERRREEKKREREQTVETVPKRGTVSTIPPSPHTHTKERGKASRIN